MLTAGDEESKLSFVLIELSLKIGKNIGDMLDFIQKEPAWII